MSVYRHQGKWRYDFVKKGERYTDSGYETKQAARDAEAEARRNLKRMNLDFLRLCRARLRDLKKRRTRKYYRENGILIGNLIKRWRHKRTITRDDVEEYLDEVAENSHHFANAQLRQIKALFNHGVEREWFNYNPAGNIKPYNVGKKPKYIPPVEDVQKILSRASPRQRLYLLVLVHTLGRSISVNNLKWDDIKEDHLILRTRKTRNSHIKEIVIPINDALKEVIDQIPHNGEYVFINNRTGKPYEYRDGLLPSLCRKAGVKRFTLHSVRHFGASLLISKGASLTDVQALLGHGSAQTTAIYLQALRGSTVEAVKKLEEIL